MKRTGLLLALAYPDHFVSATEGRYNTILNWVGIVNNGMVRAGHSAVALLDQRDGKITYADFGRYMTPFGFGRARTAITDPELEITLRARFEQDNCTNLEEILHFFANNPQLTHGEGKCYAGVYPVDIDAALEYVLTTNKKGSIIYGPFDPRGNNCSRFTYNSILSSHLHGWRFRAQMLFRFFPSIMPLDLVMTAPKGGRWLVTPSGLRPVHFGQWDIWLRLFEKWEGEKPVFHEKQLGKTAKGNWLIGLGDDALFELEDYDQFELLISRSDASGQQVFKHGFRRPDGFDPSQEFEFVYDCHATKCTLKQGGEVFTATASSWLQKQIAV